MTLKPRHFLAITVAALTLVPSGMHRFAMPNKITMSRAQYLTDQSFYSGWGIRASLSSVG